MILSLKSRNWDNASSCHPFSPKLDEDLLEMRNAVGATIADRFLVVGTAVTAGDVPVPAKNLVALLLDSDSKQWVHPVV